MAWRVGGVTAVKALLCWMWVCVGSNCFVFIVVVCSAGLSVAGSFFSFFAM